MSDQPIAEDATYTARNKHNRRTTMPLSGFKLAIPAIKQPQTEALEVFLKYIL